MKRKCSAEALESRRLLSVTAAQLAFPLSAGSRWTTVDLSDSTTDSYTVIGKATFNGYAATKVTDTYDDGTGTDDSRNDDYAAYDASKNFVIYGGVTTTTDDSTDPPTTSTATLTYTPPVVDLPAVMVAGTTYTSTSTLSGVNSDGDASSSDFTLTTKLLSDVKQKVVVPAGTFYCYEVYQTDTYATPKASVTSTDYIWLATGIGDVKDISSSPNQDPDTTELQSFDGVKLPATQLAFDQPPTSAKINTALSPAVSVDVEDVNGTVETDDASTVTMSVVSGPAGGTLSGTTSAATVNGEATFGNLKFSKPGTYTVRATDGSLTPVTTSVTITSDAAAAAKLEFATQPSPVVTGKVMSPAVRVAVEDADGVTVTDDASAVTLTVASGPVGGAVGGTVAAAAVNGVATFSNLIFNVPGTYTLTATDGSLAPASSQTFTVTADAKASKLAFAVQPSAVVAGRAVAPAVTVDVEYPGGGIVLTDSSTVTLSLASGGGALGGTVTAKAVNGVATFPNLVLTAAGSDTLKAIDGALTAATSNAFSVTAAAAAKLVFAAVPATATAGKSLAPAVTVDVEDAYGNLVTANASTVTVALASGAGPLSGTTTAAARAGVATFANLVLGKTGTDALKVTDGTLTAATSAAVTVVPGAAAKLVYAVQPATTVAGKAVAPAVVVDVEDALGNLVTTGTPTVAVTVASGPGKLTGTASVAAKAGVATFSNLVLTTAGTYTLKAADGSITATSATFAVTPAAAAKLVFSTGPAAAVAGKAESAVAVSVEDAYGNVVTSNASKVTLAVATGPGGVAGTLTQTAKNGVATFSDLVITRASTYAYKATDGALTAATSASFAVAPAAASKLAFTQVPTSAKAGQPLATAITVDVEDAFDNIITTDKSIVTISIASGPVGGTLKGTTRVTAAAGVATFAGLALSKAGTYKFTVVDGSLASATSAAITVV